MISLETSISAGSPVTYMVKSTSDSGYSSELPRNISVKG